MLSPIRWRRALVVLMGLSGLMALTALATACGSDAPPVAEPVDGPMNGVEVVVGGTPEPTDQIMSALIVVALEQRGASVVDRSGTEGTALNRDDLVAGRLTVVPEDIGTGWFIHLGETADFTSSTEFARELREKDRLNGIEWSDHSSFDDAIAPVAERDAVTDTAGEIISLQDLAGRLSNSLDALVCVDGDTLRSPDGLVRFERATGFTVPADQLETRDPAELIPAVAEGDCTVAFVPRIDPAIADSDLAAIDVFAPEGTPELVFTPRNAAYMFDTDFYREWESWLGPFLETLMVTLDADTMTSLKAELLSGQTGRDIAIAHLERNDLL